MNAHQVVSHADWVSARKALLAREKEFTQTRETLASARRELPWERVEKRYVFDGPAGEETLADLFQGRSQLVVYHFMFAPDATEGCKACSFWADSFERSVVHLAHRDVTLIAVSRAPLAKLTPYKARLGWSFKWVSSNRTSFNFDYGVSFEPNAEGAEYNYAPKSGTGSEMPGISVFYKDEGGAIFHTYSTFGRGLDMMNATYQYLDLVPKGRDEAGLPFSMTWLKRRDEYESVK